MKRHLILLIFLLPVFAFAEYNGHQIKFSIELKNGREIVGYNYLADVYQENKTMTYNEFLEKNFDLVLRNYNSNKLGEFTYFQKRIKYEYSSYSDEKRFIFTLLDEKEIDTNNIKTFKIIELSPQSYTIGISSKHQWSDREWMKTDPVEKHWFGGLFCSNNIFIHNKNEATDKVIEVLNGILVNHENTLKEHKQELENSEGDRRSEIERKIEKLEEDLDEKVAQSLKGFDNMDVVIITMCSC